MKHARKLKTEFMSFQVENQIFDSYPPLLAYLGCCQAKFCTYLARCLKRDAETFKINQKIVRILKHND